MLRVLVLGLNLGLVMSGLLMLANYCDGHLLRRWKGRARAAAARGIGTAGLLLGTALSSLNGLATHRARPVG